MCFELTSVIKLGKSIYSTIELSNKIDAIYESIIQVYHDFSESFKKTAMENIKAATISNKPEREISMAIVSLENAYHVLQTLYTKTNKESLFIIFKVDLPVVDDETKLYEPSWKLSLLIFELYIMINEPVLANRWKENARKYYVFQYIMSNSFYKTKKCSYISDEQYFLMCKQGYTEYVYRKEKSTYYKMTNIYGREDSLRMKNEGIPILLKCIETYNNDITSKFEKMAKDIKLKVENS